MRQAEVLREVHSDLSSALGIEQRIGAIRDALGARPLAALVNGAAAVTPVGPLADHSCVAMLDAFTMMAVAPARLATSLAPLMVEGGRVLNLSTRSSHGTFPGLSLYCMSKHALHSIINSLRLELPATLAVAQLIPGEVDTGMQADLRAPDSARFPLATFFRHSQANLIPCALADLVHRLGAHRHHQGRIQPRRALVHLRPQQPQPLAAAWGEFGYTAP